MDDQFNNMSFFIELGKPLAKARTVKETLNIVMYQVGKIFQPVNWSLLLKDTKHNEMIFSVVVGEQKKKLQGMRIPMGKGIVGRIMETGQSIIVADVAKDDYFFPAIDENTGFQTRSIIGVPLKTDDKIFGVIELVNKVSGENFTNMELTVLEAIAEYAAIAIERCYYQHTLKSLALMDPVTGLKNKISFENAVKKMPSAFKRYGVRFGVLLLNVVNFSQINAQKGFSAGDDVLKSVARMLKQVFKDGDDIFRYGGDKFIITLPHSGREATEKMRQAVLTTFSNAVSLEDKIPFQVDVFVHCQETDVLENLVAFVKKRFSKQPSRENTMDDGMEMHLHSCISKDSMELDAEQELKVGFRKKVSLNGDFKHSNKRMFGRISVHDISMQGIGFTILKTQGFEVGDLLDVSVTLDDGKKTRIKRRVSIRIIDGKNIIADFYNPPPFDKHLGFYLMG
ncbi:diguanylate cyclase (GGDEF) domain-containing protein [Desulfocicer vacuolatum DSM 3385]|uniref:Diguanylate cyclase (GGDEF) domain-containing protein n=1 Tax=Desulfocicer vacuolatum DSM 3385 TaxID=1121400 RepID=A0A1W2B8E0_9BACT|nr:sensor domain-containing diguanylate cyclase [Desulfocicer vacuolatum]SMC68952.1 diguanylate cyclase (GGDEF) domain-containing protein [Desulfocicer vacuolatum DSM 3385]